MLQMLWNLFCVLLKLKFNNLSLPVSFLFLSFCNTCCRCASIKRYVYLKSGEDKTLSKIIFLVVSVWLFLERSCPHQNTILKYTIGKQVLRLRFVFDILGNKTIFLNFYLHFVQLHSLKNMCSLFYIHISERIEYVKKAEWALALRHTVPFFQLYHYSIA